MNQTIDNKEFFKQLDHYIRLYENFDKAVKRLKRSLTPDLSENYSTQPITPKIDYKPHNEQKTLSERINEQLNIPYNNKPTERYRKV